jgi:hypothetical protein
MLEKEANSNSLNNTPDWTYSEKTEPGAFISLRELLGSIHLPEIASLNDSALIALLNQIEIELMQEGVMIDFLDRLPARIAYKGILQMLDHPIAKNHQELAVQHLDGCDSACESCFQLQHCAIAKKVLGSEWKVAVQEAHINPSWSALLSRRNH